VTGPKTNERPGTRSVLRHYHMSATKARQVLDLIRGREVQDAADLLRATEREAAGVVLKVLTSAVANAVHNDHQDANELYVAAAYADEGTTMKRWRPRARGRATRIRKRTCHITIIVARLDDERLERRRAQVAAQGARRAARVAGSRRGRADQTGRAVRRAEEARLAAEQAEAEAAAEESTEEATDAVAGETVATTVTETTQDTTTEEAATEAAATDAAAPAEAAEHDSDSAEPAEPAAEGKDS